VLNTSLADASASLGRLVTVLRRARPAGPREAPTRTRAQVTTNPFPDDPVPDEVAASAPDAAARPVHAQTHTSATLDGTLDPTHLPPSIPALFPSRARSPPHHHLTLTPAAAPRSPRRPQSQIAASSSASAVNSSESAASVIVRAYTLRDAQHGERGWRGSSAEDGTRARRAVAVAEDAIGGGQENVSVEEEQARFSRRLLEQRERQHRQHGVWWRGREDDDDGWVGVGSEDDGDGLAAASGSGSGERVRIRDRRRGGWTGRGARLVGGRSFESVEGGVGVGSASGSGAELGSFGVGSEAAYSPVEGLATVDARFLF